MQEPEPTREDVYAFTYAPSAVDAVYPDDYTGLPGCESKARLTAEHRTLRSRKTVFNHDSRLISVSLCDRVLPECQDMAQAVRLALHYGEDAPRRHRRLRRGRRAAAGRRVHRHAGAADRLEHAARRTRHPRHRDGHRLRRRPAGLRDPVLRLRLQRHGHVQGRRQPALGRRRRLRHAHRRDDAHRRRHSRQHLPLAQLRELGQPAGRAGRSSCRRTRSTPTAS